MVRIGKPVSRSRAAAVAIRGMGCSGSCGLEIATMADCIVEYAFSQYSLPFNPHPCKVLPSDQVIRLAVGEGEGGHLPPLN